MSNLGGSAAVVQSDADITAKMRAHLNNLGTGGAKKTLKLTDTELLKQGRDGSNASAKNAYDIAITS